MQEIQPGMKFRNVATGRTFEVSSVYRHIGCAMWNEGTETIIISLTMLARGLQRGTYERVY